MLGYMLKSIPVLLLIMFLQGCMTIAQKITTQTLTDSGIVVARIGTIADDGFEQFIVGHAYIDGKEYDGPSSGYLKIALPPGMHTLENVTDFNYNLKTTYPVNKSFRVETGKVTNLGRLLMVLDKAPLSGKFITLTIDNTPQMMSHLKTTDPEVFSSLVPGDFSVPKESADPKTVETLRKTVAAASIRNKRNAIQRTDGKVLAYGALGSLVVYTIDQKTKKLSGAKILETSTFDAILNCKNYKSTTSCLTNSSTAQKLYVYNGRTLASYSLKGKTKYLHQFYDDNGMLMLVADNMSVATSRDLGKTWRYGNQFAKDGIHSVRFSSSEQGFYMYSKYNPVIVSYNKKSSAFTPVQAPAQIDELKVLLETRSGLYALPNNTMLSDSEIYLLEPGSRQWQERATEYNGCSQLKVLDKGVGKHLSLSCGVYNRRIESADMGLTWAEVK